jgi:hypothetical protein
MNSENPQIPRQSVTQLLKQLQSLQRERKEFPETDETQQLIFDYRELIYDVQIECERRRLEIRTQFAISRKRITKRIVDNLEIEETSTMFNWEMLDKPYLAAIDLKEAKAIQYFTDLINKTRNEQQTAIPSR